MHPGLPTGTVTFERLRWVKKAWTCAGKWEKQQTGTLQDIRLPI
jgi:hypothetical protein